VGVLRFFRPRKYAARIPPAIANTPNGTPTPRPIFAPVERPPEPCWPESAIAVEDEAVELALLITVTVAAAVASAETAVNSAAAVVVAVPPLEEPVAKVLELIPSHITNFIFSYLCTNFLSNRESGSGQCYRMTSPSNIQ